MKKQPFENYPELAKQIEWGANNYQIPGLSRWTALLQEINKVCESNANLLQALVKIRETTDCVLNEYAFDANQIADTAINKALS